MKWGILTILLIISMLSIPASADLFDDLDLAVNDFNENVDQVPSSVKYVIGNEEMLLFIDMNDASKLAIKAVTNVDLEVTTFEDVNASNPGFEPDLIVTSSEDVVRDLLDSEDAVADFNDAYDNGKIMIEAASTIDKIIISVGGVFLKLLGTVGVV
ncbi:hypothetical protein [Methanococcoides burtonii]|uniref:Uncharacterized protein n=1 Tax=Methanococcoides burtonii (strain DSM 6242 / NBRC 107633 / OCM 468 / ACE-M) TaxID=259564 RepID=Q12TF1_METBU|nr:hypothetical protein [Methanococcoides burtonii]ABE53275.1 Hypothetical protein Mbur_2424 [Methanococcoides burtonii DSM 6242]